MKKFTLPTALCAAMIFLSAFANTAFSSNEVDNFEEIRTLAKKGNVEAQVKLAELYCNAHGVEKDIEEAIKWYRKAAKEKHIPALMALGNMYFNGSGVDKDEEEAFEWYEKAAKLGSADGQLKLVAMYLKGEGVDKDERKAFVWMEKAAEQGNAGAQNNLGAMYEKGQGVAQDYTKAVEWYRKSAEQGDAAAQCNLGFMYENGRGVSQDYAEAVKWYHKAAEQGRAVAQNNLGVMYQNGRGVAQDYAEAVKWYRKSAEQGNAQAQCNLGFMYELGQGVSLDYEESMKWYTKSAEQGEQNAKRRLNSLKCKLIITPSIIEGFWTNVLENATRISVGPRSKGAESQKGEGILEAFGMQYMPNAYEYYQEVRAKAIEREQIFKENFPEGIKSDSTGGKLYTKVQKATAKAVGEYFRRRDELCHFYLMHKAGIMNSQDLMKPDEAKISVLLPAIDSELVELKTGISKPTESERIFAEKYMPSTLAAYDRISKQMTETLELLKALSLDCSILDALRGNLALNIVTSRLNLILENNNALVATFKQNSQLHSVDAITIEDLAKQDDELSVKMQSLEKKLPIHDYGKEWLSQNWTDKEKFYVILKEASIFALRISMVEIPKIYYLMCKYEVTQGLWEVVMGNNPSKFKGDPTRPVESVSWEDVNEFLKKLNALPEVRASGLEYRLSEKYEWEDACRAGATGHYCKLADGTEITKETLGEVAWFEDNSHNETHTVGQKMPNAYGLYDMLGNVSEWTTSRSGDKPYALCGGCHLNSNRDDESFSYKCNHRYRGFRLIASCRVDEAQELRNLNNLMIEIPDKDYLMSKYEVTHGLWKAVMGTYAFGFKGDPTRPVENADTSDARNFLYKLNTLPEVRASGLEYRLPTADEWEDACRAGAKGDYCKLADGTEITKETLGEVAWFRDNSNHETHPVGQKKPNAYGLYDMHGNVFEWTSNQKFSFERGSLAPVACGGYRGSLSSACKSSLRSIDYWDFRNFCIGFRLCATRKKTQEEVK